ncbi:hypothetical protein MKK64_17520 [Methylobacterium sp. E-025]|uniref:hypothetical protein n=1 Tax=Methylobacterium sp. E-025 TaxID=2836561 RepID=UPI001FB8A52B|nr:hypothetical protein [Methylobacterium sp. E-025]MCJ2112983.1 hypothetical protein [Methylobacterium sp. E-025]
MLVRAWLRRHGSISAGGLMINARRVEAIGDTWIRYGNQTYRRDWLGRPVGVPVWEAAR